MTLPEAEQICTRPTRSSHAEMDLRISFFSSFAIVDVGVAADWTTGEVSRVKVDVGVAGNWTMGEVSRVEVYISCCSSPPTGTWCCPVCSVPGVPFSPGSKGESEMLTK